MNLEPSRLQNVHAGKGCIVARCPACAQEGADRKGNNLAVFPTGAYYCHAHPKDLAHNREILRLAGSYLDGSLIREERERRGHLARIRAYQEKEQEALARCVRENRAAITARYRWTIEEVLADSTQRLNHSDIARSPQHFLASLFDGNDLLWTGDVRDTGHPNYRRRWRRCAEWVEEQDTRQVGPYTTAATWKPNIHSRSDSNVLETRFAVMDFDGFDGIKPTTTEEIDAAIQDALAIVRMFRESLLWKLVAIVHTGNKGIHAWFEYPSLAAVESARKAAKPLGIDPKVLGAGAQPCRMPGHLHHKSKKISELWWLA